MPDRPLIGVIDSGFSPAHTPSIIQARRFWLDGDALLEGDCLPDTLGHGSAVLDAMSLHATGVRLCVAQVFTGHWQASPLQVAAALFWLLEQGVSLVNMSLGLRSDRPILSDACRAAQAAGVLLCASTPAQGATVYPAGYPSVIRVTGDARCGPAQWSCLRSAQADFGAYAGGQGIAGASSGCAMLSGIIAGHLQQNPGVSSESVLHWLQERAAFNGPERRGHG